MTPVLPLASALVFIWTLGVVTPCHGGRLVHEKSSRNSDASRQPVHHARAWEWVTPINGSGYCGPAALYQIIAYYGDFGTFEIKARSGKRWLDRPLTIRPIRRSFSRFVDDSDFAKYIQPYSTGSNWTLMAKVSNLYRSRNPDDPLYHIHVCSSSIAPENIRDRSARLDDIREKLLNHGVPVVIHLDGVSLLPGHYLTLIGDDLQNSSVFFVDSLKPGAGIQAVPRDAFLKDWFYVSGKHYKARWDGTWMAFWRPGKIRAFRDR